MLINLQLDLVTHTRFRLIFLLLDFFSLLEMRHKLYSSHGLTHKYTLYENLKNFCLGRFDNSLCLFCVYADLLEIENKAMNKGTETSTQPN